MAPNVDVLFTPFSIGRLTLPNRIVMAPMTRARSPRGVPGPDVAAYYRRRAAHGVGLIMTEGTGIDHPAALGNPNVPRFHGADALAGWTQVLSEVRAAGGRIMPQLWHVGTARAPGSEPNPEAAPIGPSGLTGTGTEVGPPMTLAEIDAVIAAYAAAAADAARLGFDGIELHGAHGYLIDQFFWEVTNRRSDRYGGDLASRTRFAADVIRACRTAVGREFPIVVRFSQWKIASYDARLAATPGELERFLTPLVDAGVDVFHCSTRQFWQPEFDGSALNLAGWTKRITGRPTITVGSVGLDTDFLTGMAETRTANLTRLARLVQMIEEGEADLVAVGRALIADAAWAEKVRQRQEHALVPYTRDALATLD